MGVDPLLFPGFLFPVPRSTPTPMATPTGELLQGTLAMLVLKTLLVNQSAHGYGIARWIEETTGDVLRIEEGSLYPALRRVEDKGWVTSKWGVSENNRRARYYSLTPAGREQLRAAGAVWMRYAAAVTSVMRAAPATV